MAPVTIDNPGLPRIAVKMAAGSGKTLVMAMLIAWQALNKLHDRQDARFSDALKVAAARTLWVPAVNNHGGFGRWAFVEVTDVYEAIGPIREEIRGQRSGIRGQGLGSGSR